jgi:hypothetical protein
MVVMTPWYDLLHRDRPLAVVADGRTPELAGLLQRMLDDWEQPFSVWLTQTEPAIFSWAASHGIQLQHIDEVPTISVHAPCLVLPMTLSAGVLHPIQLVFLAHGTVSREGILLGGLFSLSCLVPRSHLPCTCEEWNLLLLELYRRFQGCQVIIPLREGASVHLAGGDAWALDEHLLAGLPPQAGAFHAAVRRMLLPPAGNGLSDTCTISSVKTDSYAYPCGTAHRFRHRVWEMPRKRLALVTDKVQTIVTFRCRKYWRLLRGNR